MILSLNKGEWALRVKKGFGWFLVKRLFYFFVVALFSLSPKLFKDPCLLFKIARIFYQRSLFRFRLTHFSQKIKIKDFLRDFLNFSIALYQKSKISRKVSSTKIKNFCQHPPKIKIKAPLKTTPTLPTPHSLTL